MELSQLDDVAASARSLSLSPRIVTSSVSLGLSAQPAMIVTEENALRVTHAVETTVDRVREMDLHTTSDR
jgi:hypothetical protein